MLQESSCTLTERAVTEDYRLDDPTSRKAVEQVNTHGIQSGGCVRAEDGQVKAFQRFVKAMKISN